MDETAPPAHLRSDPMFPGYATEHWLTAERASRPTIAQWLDGKWYCFAEHWSVSPAEMYRRGWRYLKPVSRPDDAERDHG